MTSEPNSALALKEWLEIHGGMFHPNSEILPGILKKGLLRDCITVYRDPDEEILDDFGFRIVASTDIPADTQIVSCPVELIVTPQLSRTAIRDILGISDAASTEKTSSFTERQWIAMYLALHEVLSDERLILAPYLRTLPPAAKLRTPLHFTSAELDLFKGSNLFGASVDRKLDWSREWEECKTFLSDIKINIPWESYLTASTYISSRAFPSSLLSPTPSLVSSSSTYPILIPGVDSLNHARGHPVSWVVTSANPAQPDSPPRTQVITRAVALLHHQAVKAGQEILNNYGPKPNAELILGYGFSIPNNPDDTIVLKLGGKQGQKWEIGRGAKNAEGLWNEILSAFVGDESEGPTYEDILDASGQLAELVETLLQNLPREDIHDSAHARPEVLLMREHYLEGQRSILHSLLEFTQQREQDAIAMAKEQGVELVLEDD